MVVTLKHWHSLEYDKYFRDQKRKLLILSEFLLRLESVNGFKQEPFKTFLRPLGTSRNDANIKIKVSFSLMFSYNK